MKASYKVDFKLRIDDLHECLDALRHVAPHVATTQPTRPSSDLEEVLEAVQTLAADAENPPSPSQCAVCQSTSEVRTVCGSPARTGLCGGWPVRAIPTASLIVLHLGMPRRPRVATGGYVYHTPNRAVGRRTIFEKVADYSAFEQVLEEARSQVEMRLLDDELMPNHWHLVLSPREDGDRSNYMDWLTNTHTPRWHLTHETVGTGPLYQGRFKSFAVQEDKHF